MADRSRNRQLYDAHCHLQDARLKPFRARVIEEMARTGIARAVVNGTSEEDWPEVQGLAEAHPFIIPSYGLHPWFIKARSADWNASLRRRLVTTGAAVGEIGLDRWIEGYDLPEQERVFVEQLALATELERPVSIHCLRAWGRMLEILRGEKLPPSGFLLHSYGGPAEMVSSFVDLGGYFSLSGYFAAARKERQREVFRRIPLDRLLIESDAPDMAPPPERQEFTLFDGLNHPANLRAVYQFGSELRGMSFEDLASAVSANFHRLFG